MLGGAPYVGAAIGIGTGLANIIKGKAAAKRNIRPTLDQSGLYEDMLAMYEQQAQYGFDASTMQFLTEENQNALTGTLQAMLLGGASPNDVAGAYAGYSNQMQKAAAESSAARWQKISALSGATDKLFQSQQEEFLYNEDGPYKDRAQAAAAQMNVGQQQLWGGLQSAIGTGVKQEAGSGAFGSELEKQLKAIFGANKDTGAGAATGAATGDFSSPASSQQQQIQFEKLLKSLFPN